MGDCWRRFIWHGHIFTFSYDTLGSSHQISILRDQQPRLLPFCHGACREWGFFHITNQGISNDLFKKLHSFSSQIFNLHSEVKLKAGPLSTVKTYTPHFIASPFYESLRVSGPDFSASAKISSQTLLNESNQEFRDGTVATETDVSVNAYSNSNISQDSVEAPGITGFMWVVFSEILEEYGIKMMQLSKIILERVIKCLGDDFEMFLSDFKNCGGYLRINNYSPPDCIENQEVEGLGMHTDMSCITIVFQDDIGGLQVRSKEGQWMDINPQENTLLVNIGDLMQA